MNGTIQSGVRVARNATITATSEPMLRLRLKSLASQLETVELDQCGPYTDEVCLICGIQKFSLLDESRLILSTGSDTTRAMTAGNLVQRLFGRVGSISRGTVARYSNYEIRQEIVRSGYFSRSQLSPSGLFTEHELEVNDRSFMHLRPLRCGCDFGEADEDLTFDSVPGPSTRTHLEDEFISGRPVRTGFRLRSREAIRKRRSKFRRSTPPVLMWVNPYIPKHLRGIADVGPSKVLLRFDYISRSFRRVPPRNTRNPKTVKVFPKSLPMKGHTKYWYFMRKRKEFHLSEHHPLPGDFVYPKG